MDVSREGGWGWGGHLPEPPLAMLAQVSGPSPVTDAGAVDAFPRQTVLVARLGRGGVSDQHEGEQNVRHQVFVDVPRVVAAGG